MDTFTSRSRNTEPETSELPTIPRERRQLGRYQVCRKVASGGMANVYLARLNVGQEFQRLVALKVLHARLARDPQFVDMFFDEARVATLIHHPYVCSVFDFDVVDGTYFLAMDFLVGESLKRIRHVLAREEGEAGKGDPAKHAACVARMLADASEGLHAAHELRDPGGDPLDVVHRDIAPDNLFLTYDGIVKVIDFGLASAARARHRTRTGILKGKLAYVAPELLRGACPDRRADVWGLGVVLWEMLTLRRLFHRSSDVATLGAVFEPEVPPPSAVRPGLPEELDAVVLRALARNPDDRHATTRELGRDLVRVVAQRGEVVDNALLSDWMDRIFPGGRSAHRRLLEAAARPLPRPALVRTGRRHAPQAALSRSVQTPSNRRRWRRLLVAPIAAALLALALLACLGRRSIPADRTIQPRDSVASHHDDCCDVRLRTMPSSAQ